MAQTENELRPLTANQEERLRELVRDHHLTPAEAENAVRLEAGENVSDIIIVPDP